MAALSIMFFEQDHYSKPEEFTGAVLPDGTHPNIRKKLTVFPPDAYNSVILPIR